MAKEKITRAELQALLVACDEFASKNEAERFVSTLERVFRQQLIEQGTARLAGIGTFRLQWVEPRKSVNVNTGESIEIEGHYKLAFTADAQLKDMVGNSSAEVETPKEMPLQKLAEQAVEIGSLLDEINGAADEVIESLNEPEVPENQTEPSDKNVPEPVVQTVVVESLPTRVPVPDEQKERLQDIGKNVAKPQSKRRRSLAWLWILLVLLTLCGAGFATYYFYGDVVRTWVEGRLTEYLPQPTDADAIETPDAAPLAANDETANDEQTVFDEPRDYAECLAVETIQKGGRLAVLAERHYGHRDFWVYIFEANRNVLAHPDSVEPGMQIRIPRLDKRLVDATNPDAVAYAQRLGEQYK